MKRIKIQILILVLFTVLAFTANGTLENINEVNMEDVKLSLLEGSAVLSIIIAYDDFKHHGYDLNNYLVNIDYDLNLTITFVPKFHPDEGTPLGGKTRYGREISYLIDKDSGQILKKYFAR